MIKKMGKGSKRYFTWEATQMVNKNKNMLTHFISNWENASKNHEIQLYSNRYSHILLVGMQDCITLSENSLVISYKDKYIPNDPTISLIRIYSREMKTYIHSKTVHKCSY